MGSGEGGIYQGTYGGEKAADKQADSDSGSSTLATASNEHAISACAGDSRGFERNAISVKSEYQLHADGFFAERGVKPNRRIYRCEDPIGSSRDFFNRLSDGGKLSKKPKLDGYCEFPDGTKINFRLSTKTPNSPAVQISNSGTDLVKDQKVHFLEEVQ